MEADAPRTLLPAGLLALAVTEVALLTFGQRQWLLPVAGVAVALLIFLLRQVLNTSAEESGNTEPASGTQEVLERWMARNALLISWAEGNQEDWDRHLRPLLAREFALASGIQARQDPAAHTASGLLVFGEDLWKWVDPDNTASTNKQRALPGPGKTVLNEVLERLERA
jgi:hypothetical protein